MSLRMRPESNRYCSPVTGEMAHCVALKRADWAKPPSPEYPGSGRPRVRVPLAFTTVLPNQMLGVLSTASVGMKVLRCSGLAALP